MKRSTFLKYIGTIAASPLVLVGNESSIASAIKTKGNENIGFSIDVPLTYPKVERLNDLVDIIRYKTKGRINGIPTHKSQLPAMLVDGNGVCVKSYKSYHNIYQEVFDDFFSHNPHIERKFDYKVDIDTIVENDGEFSDMLADTFISELENRFNKTNVSQIFLYDIIIMHPFTNPTTFLYNHGIIIRMGYI